MSGPLGASCGESPVTARQLEVLRLIERSVAERGFPPTMSEFLLAMGCSPKSKQSAHELLTRLVAKGMLTRHPGIARGITLTEAARELLAATRAEPPMGDMQ